MMVKNNQKFNIIFNNLVSTAENYDPGFIKLLNKVTQGNSLIYTFLPLKTGVTQIAFNFVTTDHLETISIT